MKIQRLIVAVVAIVLSLSVLGTSLRLRSQQPTWPIRPPAPHRGIGGRFGTHHRTHHRAHHRAHHLGTRQPPVVSLWHWIFHWF